MLDGSRDNAYSCVMPAVETKKAFRERLEKERRYKQFVDRREALIKAGTPRALVWKKLMFESEFSLEPRNEPVELEPEVSVDDGQGLSEASGEVANDAEAIETDPEPDRPPVAQDDEARDLIAAAYERLTAATAGRPTDGVDYVKMVQWVFNHVSMPLEEIDAKAVPCTGAVGLLKWVRESSTNTNEFYKSIWPRTLPSRSQMGDGKNSGAEAEPTLELIDRLRSISEAA